MSSFDKLIVTIFSIQLSVSLCVSVLVPPSETPMYNFLLDSVVVKVKLTYCSLGGKRRKGRWRGGAGREKTRGREGRREKYCWCTEWGVKAGGGEEEMRE